MYIHLEVGMNKELLELRAVWLNVTPATLNAPIWRTTACCRPMPSA